MSLPDSTSLGQARAWLRERINEGEHCPLCTQYAKVYPRRIHATMARTLVLAYREHFLSWFHLPTLTKSIGRGGEEGKLRYWGLLQEEIDRRPDGGRSGWWRVTQHGADFVLEKTKVPKYARVYDGRCLGLDGSETVTIRDALGKKFRYDELWDDIESPV